MPLQSFKVIHKLRDFVSYSLLSLTLCAAPPAIAMGQESTAPKSTNSNSPPSHKSESLLGFDAVGERQSEPDSQIDIRSRSVNER
jgi:hypothetical protein